MGNAPLHLAAQHGQAATVRLLLGCEVAFGHSSTSGEGSTFPQGRPSLMPNRLGQLPLHLAAYRGCLDCCKQLWQHEHKTIAFPDRRKLRPATVAQRRGHQACADIGPAGRLHRMQCSALQCKFVQSRAAAVEMHLKIKFTSSPRHDAWPEPASALISHSLWRILLNETALSTIGNLQIFDCCSHFQSGAGWATQASNKPGFRMLTLMQEVAAFLQQPSLPAAEKEHLADKHPATLIVAPHACFQHHTCPEPLTRATRDCPPENSQRLTVLTHPGLSLQSVLAS